MTEAEIIKRRILLKKQLIELTEKQIRELEEILKRDREGGDDR